MSDAREAERLAVHLEKWYQIKGDVGLREAAELIRSSMAAKDAAVRAETERCAKLAEDSAAKGEA